MSHEHSDVEVDNQAKRKEEVHFNMKTSMIYGHFERQEMMIGLNLFSCTLENKFFNVRTKREETSGWEKTSKPLT